jgi:dipeptidyl aminopeptidase/acylaminoacyl peptidase
LVAYISDEGGRPDVWVQPTGGGPATQITHVQGRLEDAAFSPKGNRLLYVADTGGDEFTHLYLTDSEGTGPRDLNADYPAQRRAELVDWSVDGKTFLFLSNLRDEKFMDLCEYDVRSGKARRLWEASGAIGFGATSWDHQHFALVETLSDVNTNLYVVDRGGKKPRLVTPHSADVFYSAVDFSRDGRTLFFTSNEGREFTSLYAMKLATGKSRAVLETPWDVNGAGLSRTGRYFYTQVNEDGAPRLALTVAKTGKPVALPTAPGGGGWHVNAFSPDDRYLAAELTSDVTPGVPYVIDLKKGTARPVAEALPPSLRNRKMAVGESVAIPSFDGRKVPAFLYRPEGAGPHPAVVLVHGGPTSQSQRTFSPQLQYFLSKGYVALVPNVRGSTGYGKAYTKLDNKDFGGGPLKDVVACKNWLVKEASVSADKVAIIGGSYGGYMVLAAATFTPTEFAAHVDYFGVSELKSLVEGFPAYWASGASFIYAKFGNPKDPADQTFLHDRSPLYYADRIERPLLVVQGDRDVRVKKDQSDRIVEAVKKKGVPVYYLVLQNEGHGFSRNESRLSAFGATDRFLDRYIFGDTSVTVLPAGP